MDIRLPEKPSSIFIIIDSREVRYSNTGNTIFSVGIGQVQKSNHEHVAGNARFLKLVTIIAWKIPNWTQISNSLRL